MELASKEPHIKQYIVSKANLPVTKDYAASAKNMCLFLIGERTPAAKTLYFSTQRHKARPMHLRYPPDFESFIVDVILEWYGAVPEEGETVREHLRSWSYLQHGQPRKKGSTHVSSTLERE